MIKLRPKFATFSATLFALGLCLVGPRAVVASPLEIDIAVRVPGPPIVIHYPLNLSLDERFAAQQIEWDLRLRSRLREFDGVRKNSVPSDRSTNPLPAFSAFLSDAYQAINS